MKKARLQQEKEAESKRKAKLQEGRQRYLINESNRVTLFIHTGLLKEVTALDIRKAELQWSSGLGPRPNWCTCGEIFGGRNHNPLLCKLTEITKGCEDLHPRNIMYSTQCGENASHGIAIAEKRYAYDLSVLEVTQERYMKSKLPELQELCFQQIQRCKEQLEEDDCFEEFVSKNPTVNEFFEVTKENIDIDFAKRFIAITSCGIPSNPLNWIYNKKRTEVNELTQEEYNELIRGYGYETRSLFGYDQMLD